MELANTNCVRYAIKVHGDRAHIHVCSAHKISQGELSFQIRIFSFEKGILRKVIIEKREDIGATLLPIDEVHFFRSKECC